MGQSVQSLLPVTVNRVTDDSRQLSCKRSTGQNPGNTAPRIGNGKNRLAYRQKLRRARSGHIQIRLESQLLGHFIPPYMGVIFWLVAFVYDAILSIAEFTDDRFSANK
jgi:hypothetical protein